MNQMQQARDTINYLLDLLETCSESIVKLDAGSDKRIVTLREIIRAERSKLDRTFTVARNPSTTNNHQRSTAMNTNEWITDRLPTEEDTLLAEYVWICMGTDVIVVHYKNVYTNEPWQPVTAPEPYVKPKRYTAEYNYEFGCWRILDSHDGLYVTQRQLKLNNDEHRKAAEEIAAIYERVKS